MLRIRRRRGHHTPQRHISETLRHTAGQYPIPPGLSDDDWWVEFFDAFIREYDRQLQQDRGVFWLYASKRGRRVLILVLG